MKREDVKNKIIQSILKQTDNYHIPRKFIVDSITFQHSVDGIADKIIELNGLTIGTSKKKDTSQSAESSMKRKYNSENRKIYTDKVLSFLKENVNSHNNIELTKMLSSRFNIITNPRRIRNILVKHKIKRKISNYSPPGPRRFSSSKKQKKIESIEAARRKALKASGININKKITEKMQPKAKRIPIVEDTGVTDNQDLNIERTIDDD